MKLTELVPALRNLADAIERGDTPDKDIGQGDYWQVVAPFELVESPALMVGSIPDDVELVSTLSRPDARVSSVHLRALASILVSASVPDF